MRKLLWSTLMLFAMTAKAQNIVAVEISGQPLQYMKDGAVIGCGLRMLAGHSVGDHFEYADVSVNLYSEGHVLFKGSSYVARLNSGTPSGKPSAQAVRSAW